MERVSWYIKVIEGDSKKEREESLVFIANLTIALDSPSLIGVFDEAYWPGGLASLVVKQLFKKIQTTRYGFID